MKKALVTGANGFIGKNLVRHLVSRGVRVTAVVRNEMSDTGGLSGLNGVDIIYCDSRAINSLPEKTQERDFDAFYHLAWDGNSGPARQNYAMQMENVTFAANAFKTSELLKCGRFLCSGTITERVAADILKFLEISAPSMIYGIAKNAAHQLCEFLSRKSSVKFAWCVLSNIYGPGNGTGNLVDYTLDSLLNGRTPEFSSASQPFDLMYIDDCVDALHRIGACGTVKKSFFIGSGRPRLLKDYLLRIWELTGQKVPIGIGKRPDDGITYDIEWFDISELASETGFIPATAFDDGILKTIESMKKVL